MGRNITTFMVTGRDELIGVKCTGNDSRVNGDVEAKEFNKRRITTKTKKSS
jgi:hypothetical protein